MFYMKLASTLNRERHGRGVLHFHCRIIKYDASCEASKEEQEVCLLTEARCLQAVLRRFGDGYCVL